MREQLRGEGISENSLEMKQRYFPKIMCPLLLADDKLRPFFVGNARAVTGGGEGFEKIPRIEAEIER